VASVRSSQTFGGVIPDCCACYFFYHAKLLAIIFVDKMWLDGRILCNTISTIPQLSKRLCCN
ncbi:MAG TPA: hypothetical protein VIJ75_18615, partial [Hanamia sp.]